MWQIKRICIRKIHEWEAIYNYQNKAVKFDTWF